MVSVSVCIFLSLCLSITISQKSHQTTILPYLLCVLCVAMARSSSPVVVLTMLSTSGFVAYVVFAHLPVIKLTKVTSMHMLKVT